MHANNNNDDARAIMIDELLETATIDEHGNFLLIVRSNSDIVGLVFNPQLALDAAEMLVDAADGGIS